MSRSLSLRLVCLSLSLGALAGCNCSSPSETDAGEDAGAIDGGEGNDSGVDAGPEDAGFRCQKDDDCAELQAGLRCDDADPGDGGSPRYECIPARGCEADYNCGSSNPDDYCYTYGLQCRCVLEDNDAGTPGVCRRRRGSCQECTEASQCGQGAVFTPPGDCRPLAGDTSGKKYCFQAPIGSCGCGLVNQNGYCVPQSNSCESWGCAQDSDCPTGSVCNRASCLCEKICRWDFLARTEAPPGCPPNTVCWVDSDKLDPASPYYGAGRCRPPCQADEECTNTALNPHGGSNLKCAGEQLSGGGLSPKRCRANGDCMDNEECPEQPPDSIYLGYCDRGSFTCKTDCRTGVDPVTKQAYRDCKIGYECTSGAGGNECVLVNCAKLGGARIACRRSQFCCGEDKNNDGTADPCPPTSVQEPNGCYDVPEPPYCTQCSSHADCASYNAPSWMTCANGSKSPSCSPLPNLCMYASGQPQGQDPKAVCMTSTWNDTTADSFGVTRDARGCPSGYVPTGIMPRFTQGNDENYCNTHDDCNVGTDAGICDFDTSYRLPDGGYLKACLCTAPGQVGECPNDPDAGITSVCKYGIATPTVCLQSVVCMPTAGLVYKPRGAPEYGCGL